MSDRFIKAGTTDLSLVGTPINVSLSGVTINVGLSAAFSVLTIPSLNQTFVESAALTESTALVFGKPTSDTMAVTELKAISLARALSDSLSATDDDTLAFGLGKADSAGFSDDEVFAGGKALSDSPNIADLNIFTFSKPLSISGAWTEVPSIGAGKVFGDGFALGDGDTLSFGKEPSDSAGFADSINNFEMSISLNDGAYVSDDADGIAGDDSTYTFVKVTSNMSAITDNDTIGFSGVKGDALSLAEAGSGRSQGYCSLDYFSEDYVGSIWTF